MNSGKRAKAGERGPSYKVGYMDGGCATFHDNVTYLRAPVWSSLRSSRVTLARTDPCKSHCRITQSALCVRISDAREAALALAAAAPAPAPAPAAAAVERWM